MKEIRKDLKLTQQDLALLLEVSRSSIALCEKGLRGIPAKAVEKWYRLLQLWQQNQRQPLLPASVKNSYTQLRQDQAVNLLNAYLQRAAAKSIQITQLLSNMEQRHEKLNQKLRLIRRLMEDTLPGSRQLLLLCNREQLTLLQLSECCPERRQLLSFKLQVLASQQKAALAGRVIIQQQR